MIALIRTLDVVYAVAVGGIAACLAGATILVRAELARWREIRRRVGAYAELRTEAAYVDPEVWGEWGWTE